MKRTVASSHLKSHVKMNARLKEETFKVKVWLSSGDRVMFPPAVEKSHQEQEEGCDEVVQVDSELGLRVVVKLAGRPATSVWRSDEQAARSYCWDRSDDGGDGCS